MKPCFGAFLGPVADRTRTGRGPVGKRAVTLNQLVRVTQLYSTVLDIVEHRVDKNVTSDFLTQL